MFSSLVHVEPTVTSSLSPLLKMPVLASPQRCDYDAIQFAQKSLRINSKLRGNITRLAARVMAPTCEEPIFKLAAKKEGVEGGEGAAFVSGLFLSRRFHGEEYSHNRVAKIVLAE